MIGISEGIVLADRYRLTQRQGERETGASWIAVDLETGSDVWVQFADHGGLAGAAEVIRGLTPPAVPNVLDTGELRMIVDSRALAALRGGAQAHATHSEIVIEFVVIKPLAGRGLPAKILRRALPPAEALAVVAMVAGALDEALSAGSHGWLSASSVWLVRRGGCVLDVALGLAYPDGSPIAVERQVSGYFAPERFAVSAEPGAAVGSGSAATEAADVFALGWLLYEALIGHAELLAEYERLVAGAGAVSTVELLALWRARARVHLTELVEADSALAVLILAALAENPSERPPLSAFAERARGVGTQLAGVAPLVVPVSRTRPVAAETAVVATALGVGVLAAEASSAEAAETTADSHASAGTVSAAGVAGGAVLGAGAALLAGEATEAIVATPAEVETTPSAEAGGAGSAGGAVLGAGAVLMAGEAGQAIVAMPAGVGTTPSAEAGGAGSAVGASSGVAAAGLGGLGALGDTSGGAGDHAGESASGPASQSSAGVKMTVLAAEGIAEATSTAVVGGEHEKELDRLAHRARLATVGGVAVAVVALGVGLAAGYALGHGGHGGSSTVLAAANANAAVGAVAASSNCPTPAPVRTVVATVTVTVTASSSPAAAASSASAAPTAITSPALPAPSTASAAIDELNQEIQYELSIGQITSAAAGRLSTAVGELKNSVGTDSSSQSLSNLTSLARSLAGSGQLPSSAELTLESILGYFYAGTGNLS